MLKRIFILICYLSISSQLSFAASAQVGYIEIEHKENRIYFHIYDMVVSGMKNRNIQVEFWLSQGENWISTSQIALDPQKVIYDPAYWNDEAYWFYYEYKEFANYGDPQSSFWGSFFVMDDANNTVLARKDIEFKLPDSVLGTYVAPTEKDDSSYNAKDYYVADHSWYYVGKYYKSDFMIAKNDYSNSVAERDNFQPERGHAEDNGEYITLWDIDFNEFYADLYGYLYQQNSSRLNKVKEALQFFRDSYSLGYAEFAEFVIACVQYTTYLLPDKLFGIYTPLEVIQSKTGDCDSRAVLLYTILRDFGYEVVVFYSDYYQHAMLGIAYVGAGDYLKYGGVKYFFVETTATGWEIGDLPPDWSDTNKWVILFPHTR
ncbi:MAG: hypothetical protein JXJ04_02400 [Spirochaetales bacterium]|nr:hypothetical protein [Spirochaetales bacterium]